MQGKLMHGVGLADVSCPSTDYRLSKTNASPIAAGIDWTQIIFLLAVMAPKMPATMMQQRKNISMGVLHACIVKPQSSPMAKNPLYNPWLAAKTLEAAAVSDVWLNARKPTGLHQKNISKTRK